MTSRLLFIGVIAVLLVNCRGEDYTQELGIIDSLENVLVSTDSMIVSLNRADIAKRGNDIDANSKFIQFNVNKSGDTLDYSTALLLTQYKKAGEAYHDMDKQLGKLNNTIDSARLSLENLKHDLANNSLEEGLDARSSVLNETTQVNEIHSYAIDLKKSLEDTRRSYDTLLPKVNAFVQRISADVAPSH